MNNKFYFQTHFTKIKEEKRFYSLNLRKHLRKRQQLLCTYTMCIPKHEKYR